MAISLNEKKARAKVAQKMLDQYFPDPKPPLDYTNTFTMLIAVLLSAQTTDVHVNKVTPTLFKLAKNAQAMAQLSVDQILECIRGVNYAPTKAKNIKNLSLLLLEKHQGKVPSTFEELEALPGVGHKTASVVLNHAFDLATFPVDTHIHRLAKRWKLSSGKDVKQTEADLKTVFPESSWGKLHLQIIYYGRAFCTARGCDGHTCPICKRLNG